MGWNSLTRGRTAVIACAGVLLFVTSTAAAEMASVTKGSLPKRTSADVATLVRREGAVTTQLHSFTKLNAKASIAAWEAKLKAAEKAQAQAEAVLSGDLAQKAPPAPAGPTHVVASGHATGDYAVASASGTANSPHKIAVVVSAAPSQPVQVSWNLVCTETGGGVGSKSGQVTVSAPTTVPLPLPAPSASCIVSVVGQLQASGNLTLQITSS